MKIHNYYIYKETQETGSPEIKFGWDRVDTLNKSEDELILSYSSKSKKIIKSDSDWSKAEGTSAFTKADCSRFFNALTGDTPEDFYNKWNGNIGRLEVHWKDKNSEYRDTYIDEVLAKKEGTD